MSTSRAAAASPLPVDPVAAALQASTPTDESPPPPRSEERASPEGDIDVILAAMEQAPEVDWLTPEQIAESDAALERLRSGRARLVRDADRGVVFEELGRTLDK